MNIRSTQKAVTAIAIALIGTAGAGEPAAKAKAAFEADREAILAMSGDFRVRFLFEETVTLDPESASSKRYNSRAFETVKVIEDRGDYISLQHLLVVDNGEDKHIVKHWRQDWTYEPASMHVFRGHDTWENVAVAPGDRKGSWSQTVYQTDDSPRYAGLGRWRHDAGLPYWESNIGWRPLPRRELKKRSDYDALEGRNRHGLFPEGWTHEQDNAKLVVEDDGVHMLAREHGVNTYTRIDDFDFTAAEEYWEETSAFWASVRATWNRILEDNVRVSVKTPNGEPLYTFISPIAAEIVEGKTSVDDAIDRANKTIQEAVVNSFTQTDD